MKRILLVSAALVALSGVTYAQEAPFLAGNYSAGVAQDHNGRGGNAGVRYYNDDHYAPRYHRHYNRYPHRDRADVYIRYDDGYYGPRHGRYGSRSRAGVSFSIGGIGVGIYDNNYWR